MKKFQINEFGFYTNSKKWILHVNILYRGFEKSFFYMHPVVAEWFVMKSSGIINKESIEKFVISYLNSEISEWFNSINNAKGIEDES